jgi:integrase
MALTTDTGKPTRRAKRGRYGDGTLYQRGHTWWIKYRAGGRWHYESSGSPDKAVAQTLLDTRRGQRASGAPVQPRLDRKTYADAAAALRAHYDVTGARDLTEVAPRLAHLDGFFRGDRLVAVTTARCEAYAAARHGQGASNATINRELAVLGRMLRLAHEHGRLARVPKIRKPTEAPPRAGFVEPAQFEAIRRRLPEDLQVAVTLAFTYGWRRDEVLGLRWREHVDLEAGTLRLDVGSTKNDDGREVDLTDELRGLLAEQIARVQALERHLGRVIPSLFPHLRGTRALREGVRRRAPVLGEPIRDFRRAWATACRGAGVPGLLKHDLRRSAVRRMVNLEMPERVAMSLTGHKTRAVFDRYHIVSRADRRAAVALLNGDKHGDNRRVRLETRRASG